MPDVGIFLRDASNTLLLEEYMKKLSEDQLEKRIAYEVSVSKLERMD